MHCSRHFLSTVTQGFGKSLCRSAASLNSALFAGVCGESEALFWLPCRMQMDDKAAWARLTPPCLFCRRTTADQLPSVSLTSSDGAQGHVSPQRYSSTVQTAHEPGSPTTGPTVHEWDVRSDLTVSFKQVAAVRVGYPRSSDLSLLAGQLSPLTQGRAINARGRSHGPATGRPRSNQLFIASRRGLRRLPKPYRKLDQL